MDRFLKFHILHTLKLDGQFNQHMKQYDCSANLFGTHLKVTQTLVNSYFLIFGERYVNRTLIICTIFKISKASFMRIRWAIQRAYK